MTTSTDVKPNPGLTSNPARRSSRKIPIVAAAATLILVVGGVLGVGAFQPSGSESASQSGKPSDKNADRKTGFKGSLTADRAVAQRISFDIATTVSGELEAKNQIELRSKLEKRARIVEIVGEGTRVKAGDVLVRLNTDQLESDLQEAQLRVETAKATLIAAENAYAIQLSENDTKLRQADVKQDLAELALKKWIAGELEADRLKNRLAVEKATRELARLKEKLEQSKQLYDKKFLSLDELKQDELRVLEAQAALDTAQLADRVYEEYQVPKDERTKVTDLFDAQAEVERVMLNNERQLASKEADRNNQRTQLQLLDTKTANLKEQLTNCIMTAPTDGLVVYASSMERNRWSFSSDGPLAVGREVNPNESLMSLPDVSQMVASVRVQEALASRIQPGQRASVKVDAAGGRVFQGRVESISVLAENGGWRDPNLREYTVKVALLDDDVTTLKPSMRCEGQIVIGRVEEATSVPVQAVFNDGAVRFVFVPKGNKFERIPVKLGRRSDTMAEIAVGVNDGDVVLLRQPEAGEVFAGGWDVAQLAKAGYTMNEQGQPVLADATGGPGAPAGPGGPNQRGGKGARTGGAKPVTVAADPKAAAPAVTEIKVDTKAEPGADATEGSKPASEKTTALADTKSDASAEGKVVEHKTSDDAAPTKKVDVNKK